MKKIGGAALVLAASGFFSLGQHGRFEKAHHAPIPHHPSAVQKAPHQAIAKANYESLPPLPASLIGTAIPGPILITDQENLVVSSVLRDLFDYFLATLGEETLGDIEARLRQHLASKLPERAFDEAWSVWQSYQSYLTKAESLLSDLHADGAPLPDQLEAASALRRAHFDHQVFEAFFADQVALDEFMAEKMRILKQPHLAMQERLDLVQALEQELPPHILRFRQTATRHMKVQSIDRELRQQGANDDDIWAKRQEIFGPDAADRLALLDQKKRAWRKRIAQFKEASANLGQQEFQELLNASFTEQERRRLQ